MKSLLVLAGVVAFAIAACPNACSGHGRCGEWDQCTCFYRWTGPDCSLRLCKEGLAWVDGGSTAATGVAASGAHSYKECSNKGHCNRETGECECFAEYEGAACERSSCPNGCSGHGKCEFIQDLTPLTGNEWEYGKIQGCRCDGGFYGKDCSKRLCPRGDDPLTIKNHADPAVPASLVLAGETYTVTFTFPDAANGFEYVEDFWWHLEIDDMWNNTERSRPILLPASIFLADQDDLFLDPSASGTVNALLQQFVNVLLDMDAIIDLDMSSGANFAAQKTAIDWNYQASGTSGTVVSVATYKFTLANPLRVRAVRVRFNNECNVAGCYPKMPVNDFPPENPALPGFPGGVQVNADLTRSSVPKSVVNLVTQADVRHESEECSSRGICDYSSGLCTCFNGFYGNACEKQTILV